MKTIYSIITGIILIGVPSTASAYYSIFYEDFNSMGTTGTTAPAGWSHWYIEGFGPEATAPTGAEMADALPGSSSVAVWNQTDPNTIFFMQSANVGLTASDPDRMLGTNPSGTRGEIIQLSLLNNSGSAISSIQITYDMQVLATGDLKEGYSGEHEELPGYLFYYLDGSTWTRFSGLDTTNDELDSYNSAAGVISFSTLLPDGETMQFRWYDDNSDAFSPDWLFAIEHVDVLIPEPSTLSLLGLGALVFIARRGKNRV